MRADTELLNKAQLELTRLNRELRELHLEEERCKLKRARLEGDRAKVQALADFCELVRKLDAQPTLAPLPFHIEDMNGAKLIVADRPGVAALRAQTALPLASAVRHKPDGLPTTAAMVAAAMQEAGKPVRPLEITDYIRKRWWPEMKTKATCATIARMVQDGKIVGDSGRYRITNANGKGHDS